MNEIILGFLIFLGDFSHPHSMFYYESSAVCEMDDGDRAYKLVYLPWSKKIKAKRVECKQKPIVVKILDD